MLEHNGEFRGIAKRKAHTIINACCASFGVTLQELQSKSRKQPLVQYRQLTILILKNVGKYMSQEDMGKLFMRDHATIIHSIRQATNAVEIEPYYTDKYNTALRLLAKSEDVPQSAYAKEHDYDVTKVEELFNRLCAAAKVNPLEITTRKKNVRLHDEAYSVHMAACYYLYRKMKMPWYEVSKLLACDQTYMRTLADTWEFSRDSRPDLKWLSETFDAIFEQTAKS